MSKKKNKETKLFGPKQYFILFSIITVFIASFLVYRIYFVKKPVVTGLEALERLPIVKDVKVTVESNLAVKSIEISIVQGSESIFIVKDNPELSRKKFDLKINPKKLGLKDGEADVHVKASAGLFSDWNYSFKTTIDTIPPTVMVIDSSYLAHQGSSAAALIRSRGADSVYLKINEEVFPAANTVSGDDTLYFVLFPISFDLPVDSPIHAVAEDSAGNISFSTVSTRLKKKVFKRDTIKISDNFISSKINPLLASVGETLSPVEAFKMINEKWRRDNESKIKEIAEVFTDKILWKGRFIQMKNSKVFSNFADIRDYLYNGEIISNSRHYGYDLASVKNAKIEAANNGNVVFAGDMGIYGNLVMLDHGLGLMTMYAHLASIDVSEGDSVKKGTTIGLSGKSGLAGGDHLHFAVLLHGHYVSPLPWWDGKWIKKRVLNVLHNKSG